MLSKKNTLRAIVFLIFTIAWLFVDEKIKEDYFFKTTDLLKPLTHESIIAVLCITLAVFLLKYILTNRR